MLLYATGLCATEWLKTRTLCQTLHPAIKKHCTVQPSGHTLLPSRREIFFYSNSSGLWASPLVPCARIAMPHLQKKALHSHITLPIHQKTLASMGSFTGACICHQGVPSSYRAGPIILGIQKMRSHSRRRKKRTSIRACQQWSLRTAKCTRGLGPMLLKTPSKESFLWVSEHNKGEGFILFFINGINNYHPLSNLDNSGEDLCPGNQNS